MTVSRLFDDYPFYDPARLVQTLCDRIAQDGVENVRSETLRRMEEGTLPLGLGAALIGCFDMRPVVSDLRRLLRSPTSTDETRLIAYAALANARANLFRELEALDPDARNGMLRNMLQLREALAIARGGGGPFRALLKVDPNDEPAVDEQAAPIIRLFLESPEAGELPDREQAGWWIQEFLVLAYSSKIGTPLTMTGAELEDVLSELMPQRVGIESADAASHAIPAIRTFFRWVAQVVNIPMNEGVSRMLDILEPHFPSMVLGETRLGPGRGFITAGLNAGFDMSNEADLEAFELQWKRDHSLDATRAPASLLPSKKKKELAAARKRKAKMEKASRKKNRRKR